MSVYCVFLSEFAKTIAFIRNQIGMYLSPKKYFLWAGDVGSGQMSNGGI